MLNQEDIKIATVLILRAPLKGDEAKNVADLLQKLAAEFTRLSTPPATTEE